MMLTLSFYISTRVSSTTFEAGDKTILSPSPFYVHLFSTSIFCFLLRSGCIILEYDSILLLLASIMVPLELCCLFRHFIVTLFPLARPLS